MKNLPLVVLTAAVGLGALSCASYSTDEKTLLLYLRSLEKYREGRFAEAAEALAKEKHFVPALVLRGKAQYLAGSLLAAEKSLKRAASLNPHDAEASLFLARVYRETGAAGEARKLAEKILGDNPSEIRALRFAAELAREKGPGGEAASAALLDRAVEASAECAMVFLDRARLRWTGGNSAGALEDLAAAGALLPADSPLAKSAEILESIIREVSP